MNIEISRRAFLAAGPLAVMGSLGLAGCGKSSISGKTLYYYSVCGSVALGKVCANKPGSASTIKFDDDTWHYVGSTELSGDWKAEGDDVVLSSSQLGTVTLVRQDDGSYVPSGSEGYGERYFVDESAAQSYYDEYTAATPDRVRDTLESATWSVKTRPRPKPSQRRSRSTTARSHSRRANTRGRALTPMLRARAHGSPRTIRANTTST